MKRRYRVEFMTGPRGRISVQSSEASAIENYIHTFWKVGLRVLLSPGRELECLSRGHQSDYVSQTVQHELEPTEPAKLESHESPAAIHHKMETYIPAWASAGWEGPASCMSREPRPPCHPSQFHQHPAPSSYLWLYQGRERESYMIKWKRKKMSKLSLQMDWFSMCKSKMVWQLYYIPTPEWSWETVTKGKSFPWYYVAYLVIFTLCGRKNSLRWTTDGLLWVEDGLSGLLET